VPLPAWTELAKTTTFGGVMHNRSALATIPLSATLPAAT
jgi:hypothetical protein